MKRLLPSSGGWKITVDIYPDSFMVINADSEKVVAVEKYESVFDNDKISITKGINARAHEGYWLYDHVLGMNLSMKAKTEREAFVDALDYYQENLAELKVIHKTLKSKVDAFVNQFETDQFE